ncbi:MAG: hypothetical protein US49_C0001G0124 [candidate division TM6 bacterium GW2011_GWF2_37_49]|nr:MAG: hypothetical protein US49_C0001G0124 [candidate division TM6 bacterium GW2011_GWF2_37_49]
MKIMKIKNVAFLFGLACISVICFKFGNFLSKKAIAQCQVIESNSIEDVKKFIEQDTLFIFDFDNVIVEGKEDYGFDAWFCAMVVELENGGMKKESAVKSLLPIYEKIQRTAEAQPVDKSTKALIDGLKADGHNVMILTVRSLCLVNSLFRQLKSVEIDIEKGSIPEDGINLDLAKVGATYCKGVLLCNGYRKGQALKAFLTSKPDLKVKNIVFVDDKLKNIDSVKATTQEMGINFVGIRYGLTDKRTKAYVLDNKSKNLVQKILNDDSEEAKKVANITAQA